MARNRHHPHPRRLHRELRRPDRERDDRERPPHRRVEERPPGAVLQRRRRQVEGQEGLRHRDLLPRGARVQRRRDAPGSRRRAQALWRVVRALPVEGAEALRVPRARRLRARLPDRHHVQRRHRLPHEERPALARSVPRRRP